MRYADRPYPRLRRSLPALVALAVALALSLVAGAPGSTDAARAATRPVVDVFPSPGTPTAMPGTQITFRGVTAGKLGPIKVVGSRSGRHGGRIEAHSDGRGVSFLPKRPFRPGERVTVQTRLTVRGARGGRVSFGIARPVRDATPPRYRPKRERGGYRTYRSEPDLHPASIHVLQAAPADTPGYMFLGVRHNPGGQDGPMIIDNQGNPVWFHAVPPGLQALDFRPAVYEGKPVLVWWQGVPQGGHGHGVGVMVDSQYHRVATIRGGNGYSLDTHELVITDRGTALFTAVQPVRYDLSSVGGPRHGVALDWIVQEVDIKTGLVVFEWHGLGHVPLRESYAELPESARDAYDFLHVNAIDVEPNGNLLLSARNTWTLYEISRHTGRVLWRVGGKRSSFKMGRHTRTAWQHDVRRQPDGTITLFDNGAAPTIHTASRTVQLRVDTRAKTVTLVNRWRHYPPISAGSQGSAQLLPNGNMFVGWGAEPYISEFSPTGKLLFDARYPGKSWSYRAFRFPWSGQPTTRPAVAASTTASGVTVYASWNGATAVSSWQVLAGSSPTSLAAVRTTPRRGFETRIAIPTAPYVAVRALDATGKALGTSTAIAPSPAS